jgi:glucosyltransferase
MEASYMLISVVVPCYNEETVLPIFYKEFNKIKKELHGVELELLIVDDGSKDDTRKVILSLAANDSIVKYISFSRNFGKEAAIYAGLQTANGDFVAVIDADLQDPISLLPGMYSAVASGEYASAATRRVTRKGEPKIRSFFARLFYKLMHKISKVDLVDGARDYRLMNRQFVNAVLSMQEYNRFSKGLFTWVGFKTKWFEFENIERAAGESKWSFLGLLLYAIDGIVAFSTFPLIIATLAGIILCILSFGAIGFIIIRKLMWGDPIQGWASITSIMLFLGGIQLCGLGIIGQYLAKVYLETKKRPIYIVGSSNIGEKVK